MSYGFIIDNRKCIGCHACTVACKSEHNVPVGVNRTWVKYIEKGVYPDTRRVFAVTRCNHCADAPCVTICPVTSLFIRQDGIVDFHPERCIGCKSCMQACPYDALYIDPESHTSAKCNYCAHRIDRGLEPACVIVCPVHAIVSGDMDDPGSEIARLLSRAQVTTRKPEKHTRPKLFYIEGDEAALSPEAAPPQASYFGSHQATGVGHYARYAAERAALADYATMTRILAMGAQESAGDGAAREAPLERVPVRRSYDAPAKGVLWDWEVTGYLWSKSIAAGVLFLPLLLNLLGLLELPARVAKGLAWTSLVFLALTGALLVKDLDRPERFLYVLLRPQWRSWLVRGAYCIAAFGALALAWALHLHFGAGDVPLLKALLVALGLLTAVYTAFLLAQAKGRDFWQSPLLPVNMVVQSAVAGSAVLLLLGIVADQTAVRAVADAGLRTALALHLLLLAAEFTLPHVTQDTARAAALITRGPLRVPFWSAVLLGNLLPLALLAGRNPLFELPALVLALTFALVLEHCWVRAPQLIALR
ncbi:MAG: polysulfide reductase NrfD [Candidatus Lambdaproteobacteria bacterium]|nr:polysulfide reductase NrfD [Candidatus Lambdaproteobacteria bacterium]